MFELNLGEWHVALVCLIAAVSILLIIKGGDWFVDAAIWVAEVTHIPKFIVGATIVSFVRFEVGEGIDRGEEVDFAAEVAAQVAASKK